MFPYRLPFNEFTSFCSADMLDVDTFPTRVPDKDIEPVKPDIAIHDNALREGTLVQKSITTEVAKLADKKGVP